MSRLPLTPITQTPLETQSRYAKITGVESGLSSTYQALFANPKIASKLAELDEIISEGDLDKVHCSTDRGQGKGRHFPMGFL